MVASVAACAMPNTSASDRARPWIARSASPTPWAEAPGVRLPIVSGAAVLIEFRLNVLFSNFRFWGLPS